MRITKTIAKETASLLLEEKNNVLNSLYDDFRDKVNEIVLSKVPIEVLDLYEKYPDYFNTKNYVRLIGNGFNWDNVNLKISIPIKQSVFEPDEKEAKEIKVLQNKYYERQEKNQELKSELEIAIFNLKTYKSVEENFPEAFLLLPKQSANNSLMVNLSDIRNRLN